MGALRFPWKFLGVLVPGVAVINLATLAYGYAIGFDHFSIENGPVENLQLFFLAVATFIFAGLIPRFTHAARLVVSGAAALCLQCFFREFKTPIANPILEFMSTDGFLVLLAAALGAFILIQFYLNWSHVPAFLGWLARFEWWPFLLAGTLLVGADLFEKSHAETIEEMLELSGSVVLAITAASVQYAAVSKARAARHAPA